MKIQGSHAPMSLAADASPAPTALKEIKNFDEKKAQRSLEKVILPKQLFVVRKQ